MPDAPRPDDAGTAPGDAGAVVFPTCLVEQLRPELGPACVQLVAAVAPRTRTATRATCCGQPAWNGGFVVAARRVARATLRALRGGAEPVVVPSGSCATMMREHWPELFAGSAEEGDAKAVAARVVELSSFLADRQHTPVEQARRADPDLGRVSFHDSCHGLRELGVKAQPRQLLSAAGVEVVETDGAERCCGFGGTFSVKLPAISVAMADDKLDEWVAAGVDTVVGGDLSCLVHLEGRARRRALPLRFRHVADVLIERDWQ